MIAGSARQDGSGGKTVLVLVPHPDDAEFHAGGTIARFVKEGARAVLVIATDGCKGSFKHDRATLIRLRGEEALRAARRLGAEPPLMLGHSDMELDALPAGFLREQFIRQIRCHRPDILIAEDPLSRMAMHPDQRADAWAAVEAVAAAPLPLVHPEHLAEGLEPHYVAEKYYFLEEVASANKIVDISATLEDKLAALAEHTTQVEFLVEDAIRQAQVAGVDLTALAGGSLVDPLQALRWAVRAQAGMFGEHAGFEYGEAFRYTRFHPMIEALLENR